MSVIDSSRAKPALAAAWVAFATVDVWLMFYLPGKETIPYHLTWASFALLYGLFPWSKVVTRTTFAAITVATGIPMIKHASSGIIGWEECSEIILMGVLVALLIWHVNRQTLAQNRLAELRETERVRAENREVAARFGSHEVRTRLTIARGFAELVRDAATDDTTRSDASLILSELDKASALTTKVLTLVRVEASTPRSLVNVDELLGSIAKRWAATVDREWSCSSTVGQTLGDAERIEAALDCLIENAARFTSDSDAIDLMAWRENGDICMAVRDTGTGIPPEDLERVTEIFQTSSSAGERAGSGLGLAIVRAIVSARGGSLHVESTEGVGTCITIRMPIEHKSNRTPYTPPQTARRDGGSRATDPVATANR